MNDLRESANTAEWDTSNREEFVAYYAEQSATQVAVDRACRVRDLIIRDRSKDSNRELPDVVDIGCNTGNFSICWSGHASRIVGVDISQDLVDIARERANKAGASVEFKVGSATDLPLDDETFDVCISPELLEHVEDWQSCLNEYTRVLRPGGSLYLTTTNWLCPKQQEFNLFMYSWYPGFVKRRFEKLAVTTRPDLVNHATYPAVNWFSFYSLRRELARRGMVCKDRFDLIDLDKAGFVKRLVVALIRATPVTRFVGHLFTPSTVILATKLDEHA